MSKQSMAQTQARWGRLLAGVEANRGELPCVEVYSAPLHAQLGSLEAELARRAALQAEVLQSTRTIQELLGNGRNLASRVANYLKAQYGLDSERLVEFGLKPLCKSRLAQGGPDPRKEENGAPWNPTVPVK